jgi:alkanesulfonate monooxygenase SsuD/methylene tetrahydromethanopterin reductase-like flavin-dependent oxidoreductase (luciferase family)
MRIGINMPLRGAGGTPLDARAIGERAQAVEAAGLEGIWLQDSMIPGVMRPDPLMWLLVASAATERVEIGTSIYIVPLRQPVDMAQRFMTLRALTDDRFTVGVGAGSTKASHDSAGVDFDSRFKLLYGHMDTIRRLCDGERVGAADLAPWPEVKGGPRFALGAWHSETSLRHAATEFDGWMCSAARTNYATMATAIERYRELGGRRAMVSTCPIDLTAPTERMNDDDSFHLRCAPDEAARRLQRLADLGFDDVLLVMADHTGNSKMFQVDYTLELLEQIRALAPRDESRPWDADAPPRVRPERTAPATPLRDGNGSNGASAGNGHDPVKIIDREITHTQKDPSGQVIAVAGDWGRRAIGAALIDIQNTQHTYFITVDGTRHDVQIVLGDGRRYVRTVPDLSQRDLLQDLPDL